MQSNTGCFVSCVARLCCDAGLPLPSCHWRRTTPYGVLVSYYCHPLSWALLSHMLFSLPLVICPLFSLAYATPLSAQGSPCANVSYSVSLDSLALSDPGCPPFFLSGKGPRPWFRTSSRIGKLYLILCCPWNATVRAAERSMGRSGMLASQLKRTPAEQCCRGKEAWTCFWTLKGAMTRAACCLFSRTCALHTEQMTPTNGKWTPVGSGRQ